MARREAGRKSWIGFVGAIVVAAVVTMSGCVDNSSGSNPPNSNSSSEGSSGAASGTTGATPSSASQPILAPEPNSYSETITVDVQPTGTIQSTTVPPLQFTFARMGADKRASFQLPTVGEVVYLEHDGDKYVEFPGRNSYALLDQQTLGITLPNLSLMSPSDIVAKLREHTAYQNLGPAELDGHTAIKYGFTKSLNTSTNAGTVNTNSVVFVDQATGLPLRAEIIGNASNGAGVRVMIETRNLDLNPQASLFDVPSNMRKVSGRELRDQIRNLAATLSLITNALQWQANPNVSTSTSPVPGATLAPSSPVATPSATP